MTQDAPKTKARLRALEARLDALEAQAAASPSPPAPGTPASLWALAALREAEAQPAVVYAGSAQTADGPVEWQMTHRSADLVDAPWDTAAGTLAALGHPVRLTLLRHVLRGDARTAAELAELEGMGTTGQVYHHLRQLVAAGWLRAGARGAHQVPPERVVPLLVVLGAAGL